MTASPSQTENNGIEARYYAPPTFTSRDPLFEKYFWLSPYTYCANNPMKFVDPTGCELEVTILALQDKKNNTNNAQILSESLQKLTGLNIMQTKTADGRIVYSYEKDAYGNPVVRHNDNGVEMGSEEARQMLVDAINSTTVVGVRGIQLDNETGSRGGENSVILDFKEIASFIKGVSAGLNSETMGYGMTFLHELDHTVLGASTSHSYTEKSGKEIGPTLVRMNKIRSQMGADYGQRLSYPEYNVGGYNYIPFDERAESDIKNGMTPRAGTKYISYE